MLRISTKAIFWTIIVVGVLVPWLTGIGVKLRLDAIGQPTVDWSYFLNPLSVVFLIPIAIYWAAPFIAMAMVARRVLNDGPPARQTHSMQLLLASFGVVGAVFSFGFGAGGFVTILLTFVVCGMMSWPSFVLRSYRARIIFIFGGFVGGTIGAIQTFASAWISMEAIMFGFFVWPAAYLAKMTLGLLIGYAAGKAIDFAYNNDS